MDRHIGFLIMNYDNGGGTERVTSLIANALVNRKYKVSIISCRCGTSPRYTTNNAIQVFSLHGEKNGNPMTRRFIALQKLNKIVTANNIDILIAVDVALYLYVLPFQMMRKCKGVAWEHFNYYISNSRTVAIARKLASRFADCVIVLGKNDFENYKSHYSKIKRLEYIYNPIALNMDKKADMSMKRVIAVGRLSKQKGFDLLIDAWSRIEGNNPEWALNIFGEGPLKQELQDQITKNGLKNIHLKGYAKDIEIEYINSSVFALSSRYEGFVLVLMEAQAKSLPCVSFNCKEGPAETIDDGVNGYLIEEGNIEKFAEALNKLMNDENLRKRFSDNARKDLGRFNTETILNKWERVLDSL